MSIRYEKDRKKWVSDIRKFGGKFERFDTKADAQAHHANAQEQYRITGTYLSRSSSPSFADVADEFIEHQETVRKTGRRVADGEIANKKTAIRHLNALQYEGATLAATRISDIRMGVVQNTLVPALFAKRANKTNRNIYAIFGQVIKYAMVQQYLLHDPLMVNAGNGKTGIELPLNDAAERGDQIGERISKEIIRKILDAAGEHRTLIEAAAFTGMRAGEQAAIDWSVIDLKRGVISIKKARKKGGAVGAPKTKAGNRFLELTPELKLALMEWKQAQPLEQRGNNLVFPNRVGNMEHDNSNWRNRILHQTCDRAGVERIRWHDLRHFFASILIYELKENDVTVAAAMGHKDAAFTREQYGHWLEDIKPTTGMGDKLAAAMK
jgi:integrase